MPSFGAIVWLGDAQRCLPRWSFGPGRVAETLQRHHIALHRKPTYLLLGRLSFCGSARLVSRALSLAPPPTPRIHT